MHIQAADDVELPRDAVRRSGGLSERFVERVVVGALLLGQAGEGAEDAGLPKDADVGGVDVLIGRERHPVAVPRPIGRVGHPTESQQVGRPKQRNRILVA